MRANTGRQSARLKSKITDRESDSLIELAKNQENTGKEKAWWSSVVARETDRKRMRERE